jgi:hypothetical protein
MTKSSWIYWVALLVPFALAGFAPTPLLGNEPPEKPSPVITIPMKDCPAAEPGKKPKQISGIQLATSTFGKEEMAKQGQLTLAGRDYAVYLPRAKSYSLKNTAGTAVRLLNTSSVICIDQNGDGRLTPDEAWNANQPIRVADQMLDVVDLAADGSKIVLRASRAPLGGVVIGRKCPPFSLTTADGKPVTPDTFAGKALLLDIWSVT